MSKTKYFMGFKVVLWREREEGKYYIVPPNPKEEKKDVNLVIVKIRNGKRILVYPIDFELITMTANQSRLRRLTGNELRDTIEKISGIKEEIHITYSAKKILQKYMEIEGILDSNLSIEEIKEYVNIKDLED